MAAEEGEADGFLSYVVGPLHSSSLWSIEGVGWAGADLVLSLNVITGHHWVWLALLSFGTTTALISLAFQILSISALSVTCSQAL